MACGAAGADNAVESYAHGDGVIATSSAIDRWANAIVLNSYQPGPEAFAYTDPVEVLGPASGVSTDVVVLGRGGSIVLDMNTPFGNDTGADFAVWENGIANGDGALFAELAFVEVSSNGTDFVRFPTSTARTTAVESYGSLDPADYTGFAGLHAAGTGTAFDLAALTDSDGVTAGRVDLGFVRYVRIIDVVGDGNTIADDGNPIYDPYPTVTTAGFDLDGVAVLK